MGEYLPDKGVFYSTKEVMKDLENKKVIYFILFNDSVKENIPGLYQKLIWKLLDSNKKENVIFKQIPYEIKTS